MIKNTTTLLLSGFLLYACATSAELARMVKPGEIDRLGYFTPVSYMGVIAKGNKVEESKFVSKISADILDSLILVKKPTYNITKVLTPADSVLQKKLNGEIVQLIKHSSGKTKVHNLNLLPTIDSVMEANYERFAVEFVASGFSRLKGNFGGQVAKGIGIGLLTAGMYVPTPIKANSNIQAIIFHSKNNSVAMYKSSQVADKEPTNSAVVSRQLNYLLNNMLKSQ